MQCGGNDREKQIHPASLAMLANERHKLNGKAWNMCLKVLLQAQKSETCMNKRREFKVLNFSPFTFFSFFIFQLGDRLVLSAPGGRLNIKTNARQLNSDGRESSRILWRWKLKLRVLLFFSDWIRVSSGAYAEGESSQNAAAAALLTFLASSW